MPVYMMRVGGEGPVKIGRAANALQRLRTFQGNHHQRVDIIRLFEGGEVEEFRLHMMFADLRLHGEWFTFSDRLLGDVGMADLPVPDIDTRPTRRQKTPTVKGGRPPVLMPPPGRTLRYPRDRGICLRPISETHCLAECRGRPCLYPTFAHETRVQ
jgi:hypothetical protein